MTLRDNVTLQPLTTFGIRATARWFASFASVDELQELLALARERRLDTLILGGGSNILFTTDFEGLVLRNEIAGIDVVSEDEDHVLVRAGAGESWHGFVQYCLRNNLGGAENLSLIPGSVGASPMQNIGAYGVEIKDIFHELEAVPRTGGAPRKFSADECRFGYRESVFKNTYRNQYVIASVTYRLHRKPVLNTSYGAITQELAAMGVTTPSIHDVSEAVIRIRTSKLPDWHEVGNAGSFFKNPQVSIEKFESLKESYPSIVGYPQGEGRKIAAGWLIEQCGWKGFREGDAGCYPKQALVLVNYGMATGKHIFDLSERIIASVREKFGVELEREVNVI
ncbi:MAG: UDP-N-acetylenolpyruvoylglucosamine reductase [Flaviaesturariibacter sp.]|nr:UDP-N-acetylenolpyruvoylglucosamine reductase [Flaviaesturariibacter sp.]